MPEWIGEGVPKNPGKKNFTERVENKIESAFFAIPENLVISVVPQESLENIGEKEIGSVKSHLFRKEKETRVKPLFGVEPPGTEEKKEKSYSHKRNLERFHLTMISALAEYLKSLPIQKKSADVSDFLRNNPGRMPAVVFWDGEDAVLETLKDRSSYSFEEVLAGPVIENKIINAVSIDEADKKRFEISSADGKNICDILRKIIIEKSVISLLRLSKEKEKEFLDKFYEPIEEQAWKEQFAETFTPEEIKDALHYARQSAGDDLFFLPGGIAPPGYLSHHIANAAGIYLENLKAFKEYNNLMRTLPLEEQKVLANFPIHSFGSPFEIKMEKFNFAKDIREKAAAGREGRIGKLVYFGSNDDVELPILTQAENIFMVDPVLGSEEIIEKMLERIRKEYDPDVFYDKSEGEIKFRFGERNFRVMIFPETMELFNEKRRPEADVAVFFQREYGMLKEEAEKALREGGLFFSNK